MAWIWVSFFRHEKAHALLLANSSPCGIPALRDPYGGFHRVKMEAGG